jgi:hypothetical protein
VSSDHKLPLSDDERAVMIECCKTTARYALQLRQRMRGSDEDVVVAATAAMMQQLDEAHCLLVTRTRDHCSHPERDGRHEMYLRNGLQYCRAYGWKEAARADR